MHNMFRIRLQFRSVKDNLDNTKGCSDQRADKGGGNRNLLGSLLAGEAGADELHTCLRDTELQLGGGAV